MEDSKVIKMIRATYADSVRELIKEANELCLKREDIINILPSGEMYVLIYYK